MKKLTLLLCISFVFTHVLNGQIIPDSLRANWQQNLSSFSYTEPSKSLNIINFGAVADGHTDNSSVLKSAISSLNGRAGRIIFPAGNYLFKAPVDLSDNVVLQGEGAAKSQLLFDLRETHQDAIRLSGQEENHFVSLKSGFEKGSRKILCDSAFYFHSGDWVEIREKNGDWNTVPIDWARWSVGQIGRLVKISGDTLFLEHPLHIDYNSDLKPQIQRIFPLQNAGLSCLKIKRMEEPDTGGGFNIYVNLAANCLISGIESDSSSGSHIYISRSTQIRVEGSYFHHAFAYDGNSTHGYGVTLAHHSGECLITNNIFEHLRHAMMVKTGANGNVFSYNYSRDPVRTEQLSDLSGDISLHGHYAYANLFEGNIVQNIIIDHYWGPSGPWNTFFRNRAELWGIIMTDSDTTETESQNFVGNETTDVDLFHGLFALTGANHFSYGNHILQQIIPAGTDSLPDESYYLDHAPAFWPGELRWPAVGLPDSLGAGTIPAKIRYQNGEDFTTCGDSVHVSVNEIPLAEPEFQIIPNPANSQFQIRFQQPVSGTLNYQLYNLQGQKVWYGNLLLKKQKFTLLRPVDIRKPGIYLFNFSLSGHHFVRKIIFK